MPFSPPSLRADISLFSWYFHFIVAFRHFRYFRQFSLLHYFADYIAFISTCLILFSFDIFIISFQYFQISAISLSRYFEYFRHHAD
jgi:hypothetical protein